MVFITSIITIVMSLVAGAYGIVLLNNLRQKHSSEVVFSFFYFQLLQFTYGVFSILGSHLLSIILLKFETSIAEAETITLFLPFLGVPFIIAAWYLFIKMVVALVGQKLPQYVAILYFSLTTLIFLVYGVLMRYLAIGESIANQHMPQLIRMVFYIIDLVVIVCLMIFVFLWLRISRKKSNQLFFLSFIVLALFIAILKAVFLHFSIDYWFARFYFLLLFFGGNLPLIFMIKRFSSNLEGSAFMKSNTRQLYHKYGITRREKEIIREICRGKSNQQIANELFISLQTVKDHVHNIFKKTNVKNRVLLTRLFSGIS